MVEFSHGLMRSQPHSRLGVPAAWMDRCMNNSDGESKVVFGDLGCQTQLAASSNNLRSSQIMWNVHGRCGVPTFMSGRMRPRQVR